VKQALTPDAAAVVKQALSLARRRGNPQVTPLHVASAMLQQQQGPAGSSRSTGLLRAACFHSHSHPLQCKALQLCFNVALNRLPTSTSPLLGHGHVYYPTSLSNALVAAFKRAQAHQRRGSTSADAQQQPAVVLAVKIELEQLVVSILDDPSVSRVMREAGFSSTQIKANVEQAVSSIEGNSTSAAVIEGNGPNAISTAPPAEETKPSSNKLLALPLHLQEVRDEDVQAILDFMASRSKRRFMVVAERAATAEAAARAAVERIDRGEAPAQMRGAQVLSLRVSRFRDMPRDDAERRLAELRRAVRAGGGGAVVFVEDLAWAAEFFAATRAEAAGTGRWPPASGCCSYYSAVDRVVAELRALACHDGDGVWLVGHGTYQSYMRCRAGRSSLEMLWELQTVAVPAGSLGLSLNCLDDRSISRYPLFCFC
jgi:ATP-dependent Clp protease ATP-binding subunit ClpA